MPRFVRRMLTVVAVAAWALTAAGFTGIGAAAVSGSWPIASSRQRGRPSARGRTIRRPYRRP